jgi:hypothetical protein
VSEPCLCRVRRVTELRIPAFGDPELLLVCQLRDIAIMTASQMPDEPSDTVPLRIRLVMEFLFVQALNHLFDVMGDAQEEVQNELLPYHGFSLLIGCNFVFRLRLL